MATPAASSRAELMRKPVDRRAIDVSMSRFTLEADAAAKEAALFVAIASAIVLCPFVCPNKLMCPHKLTPFWGYEF
jgi:hypothetical protein